MSLEFNLISSDEYCTYITDGTHGTHSNQESGKYLLSAKDILDGNVHIKDNSRIISEDDFNKIHKNYKLENYDVLLTVAGTIGRTAIIKNYENNYTFQRSVAIFKTNDKIKSLWLYYYLNSPIGKQIIKSLSKGTTQLILPLKDLRNLEIPVPKNIVDQKKILSVLTNIDKKIEINKKINKNLFKLSRYLYKEFYMDKVESYDKKKYVTLDDVTSKFATGLNPRKNFVLGEGDNYYVTIKNMANNSIVLDDKCASITDEALVKINKRSDLQVGDLLFSGIGTIGRVHLIDEKPTNWNISESVFTMRPNELISSEFLFIMLLSQEIQEYAKSLASGSVQKGIRMRDLQAFEFILPNDEDKSSLDSLLIPIIADIKSNEKEIKKLTKLRDTLLPKLMSGEIDVSKINCDL